MKPISLRGESTIYEMSSLHQQVLKDWKSDRVLALDLAAITTIDPSFVQLLMSCKQTAQHHQQNFELLNAPDELTRTIDAMMLTDFFAASANDDADDPLALTSTANSPTGA